MRNMDNDQVGEVARDIVRDYLIDGPEFITIAETTADYSDEPDNDDILAVDGQVKVLLSKLIDFFDEQL